MSWILIIAALLVIFVIEAILAEVESFGWATVTLIAGLATFHFCHLGGFDLLALVKEHTMECLIGTGAWFAAGVLWSFGKWFSFLLAFRDKYRQLKESFLKSKSLPLNTVLTPDSDLHKEFLAGFNSTYNWIRRDDIEVKKTWYANTTSYRGNSLTEKPRASNNKSRIISWMAFWPFSMVGTLINDPIRRAFNFLFNSLKALYQKMADRIMAEAPELK